MQRRIPSIEEPITPPPNYDAALHILAQSQNNIFTAKGTPRASPVVRRSLSVDQINRKRSNIPLMVNGDRQSIAGIDDWWLFTGELGTKNCLFWVINSAEQKSGIIDVVSWEYIGCGSIIAQHQFLFCVLHQLLLGFYSDWCFWSILVEQQDMEARLWNGLILKMTNREITLIEAKCCYRSMALMMKAHIVCKLWLIILSFVLWPYLTLSPIFEHSSTLLNLNVNEQWQIDFMKCGAVCFVSICLHHLACLWYCISFEVLSLSPCIAF